MKICKRCKSVDDFIDYESENMDGQEFDEKGKPVVYDMCRVCSGTGVLQGGLNRPSVSCSNCHGSGNGNYKYQVPHDYSKEELKKEDNVNHPKHYTFGKIEVIDVIEDWQLGFHEGNCVKYIARAKHKGNELEDLKKAEWYLNRKINQLDLNKEK